MRLYFWIFFLLHITLVAQVPDMLRADALLKKIQTAHIDTPVDSIRDWYNEAAFSFALAKEWKQGSALLRQGASFLLKQNRTQEAKEWLSQAENWDAEYQGTKNLAWAQVMEYGAKLNQRHKDEKTAFALWQECLTIRKKFLSITDTLLYQTYYNLGVCAEKNGEWEIARECLVTCQALNNDPPTKRRFALKTAEISMNLMDYKQALVSFQPLLKKNQDSITYALYIAECFLELNMPDSAGLWLDLWYKQVKNSSEKPEIKGYWLLAKKSLSEKSTRTALNWIQEARNYADTSQKITADLDELEGEVWEALSLLDNAEKYYLHAYEWHITHVCTEFSRAYSAWKLGQVYIKKRKYDKALTYLLAAEIPIEENMGSMALITNEIRYQIASILQMKDKYSDALRYTQAILHENSFDPAFFDIRTRTRLLETELMLKQYTEIQDIKLLKYSLETYLSTLHESLQRTEIDIQECRVLIEKAIGVHLELFTRTLDSTWLYQAWDLTDQNRKLTQSTFVRQTITQEKESQWLIEQQKIVYKNLWKRALSGELSIWETRKLHEKLDSLQQMIIQSHTRDSSFAYEWIVQPWKINTENHVISYFIGQENQYIFYSNTQKVSFKVLPTSNNRDTKVYNFRKAIIFRDFTGFVSYAYPLYEEWLAPILQSEIKSIKKLVICPDAYLFYLPFEALSTQATTPETPYYNIPYVINRVEISYALTYPKQKKNTTTQNIMFFQPNLTDSLKKIALKEGFNIFQPDFIQETDSLAHDGSAQWIKPGNSSQLSKIQANNFVQWNVPLFIKEENLSQSCIYFSDGLFRLLDIPFFKTAGLSIAGIDWSLDYKNRGLGMLYLLHSIRQCCDYVYVPLWKMEPAIQLRLRLYQNIKHMQPSSALRLAQLSVIKDKKSHPLEWAGLLYYETP